MDITNTSATFTTKSIDGRRVVVTNEQNGRYSSRLYVNAGETATLTTGKAKTLNGARQQAARMVR